MIELKNDIEKVKTLLISVTMTKAMKTNQLTTTNLLVNQTLKLVKVFGLMKSEC